MYADTITGSMKRALDETARRRQIQDEYNKKNGIVPKTIIKGISNTLEITKKADAVDMKNADIPEEIEKLKAIMKIASQNLDFEKCIELREKIAKLKMKMRKG
jgi:excinuclease ABC subunit B